MAAAQTTAPLIAAPQAAVTRLKWLYLTNYAAYGCTSIYRNLYFRRVGLDNSELGLLIAVQPLLMLVAGPLWSMLADRLNLRSRLLTVVMALSVIPIIATPFCTRFWPLLGWSVLYALLQAPMQPLMDSSAVVALGANRHQYSVIRAYGSLGYAPMVCLTGVAVQWIDLRWAFAGYVVLMLIAALVSLGVRSDERALQSNALDGLDAVRKDRAWRVMMGAFFVNTVLQAVAFGYSSLYLDTLGASEGLIGLSGRHRLALADAAHVHLAALVGAPLGRRASAGLFAGDVLRAAVRVGLCALPLGCGGERGDARTDHGHGAGWFGGLCRAARAARHGGHRAGADELLCQWHGPHAGQRRHWSAV